MPQHQVNNFPGIARDAVDQARSIAPGEPWLQQALILANVLPRLLVPAMKQVSGYEQQPRVYTHASTFTLAATNGVSDTKTINWTANADFLWTTLGFINGADGSTAFNSELQISFGGNDRQMINKDTGVHPIALIGVDKIPFLLPKAFVLRKRDSVNLKLTNVAATAVAYCFIYFIGIDYMDASVLDGTRRVV